MTLIELLLATAIMSLMAAGLATLASAVNDANGWNETAGAAAQHARVVFERIGRNIAQATANEKFPGAMVITDTYTSYTFPQTLVVWRPSGAPADPAGLPRFNEIVVYVPLESNTRQLVEMTFPQDGRIVPAVADVAGWQAEMAAAQTNPTVKKSVLTDRLHLARISDGNMAGPTTPRGVLRFNLVQRPSAAEWAEFRAGSRAWSAIPWVQGFAGQTSGLAQSWVRMELQLSAGTSGNYSREIVLPFYGSAALYYRLTR